MTTFKQFVAESATGEMVKAMAQRMLSVDSVQPLYGDVKDFSGAKHLLHKFVDTVNGPWVVTLCKKGAKRFVVADPPKGSSKKPEYFTAESISVFEALDVPEEAEIFSEALHSNVIGHIYSSKIFTYSKAHKSFTAEISETPKVLKQLWNDSADLGFGIRSEKTGNTVLFTFDKELKDRNNDDAAWTFKVYNPKNDPKLKGLTAIIFND